MKAKVIKFFVYSLVAVLLIGILGGAFVWFGSYSSGSRTGRLIKLSEKGFLMKTWEGELNMESLGHSKSTGGLSTVWQFSVDSNNEKLLEQLDSAMVNNLRVQVVYSEKFMLLRLRGETKYFVEEIKFTDGAPEETANVLKEKQLPIGGSADSLAKTAKDSLPTEKQLSEVKKDGSEPIVTEIPTVLTVDFEITNNGCYAPCTVRFNNESENAVAYFWDFGDGDKSDEEQPAHTFKTAGQYEVTLRVTDSKRAKIEKTKWVVVR